MALLRNRSERLGRIVRCRTCRDTSSGLSVAGGAPSRPGILLSTRHLARNHGTAPHHDSLDGRRRKNAGFSCQCHAGRPGIFALGNQRIIMARALNTDEAEVFKDALSPERTFTLEG